MTKSKAKKAATAANERKAKSKGPAPQRNITAASDPLDYWVENSETLATLSLPATKDGLTKLGIWVIPSSLAWLKGVASSFQRYEWHHLRFEFASMVGPMQSGMVGITHTTDVRDTIPKTMGSLLSFGDACVGSVHAGAQRPVSKSLAKPIDAGIVGVDIPRAALVKSAAGRSVPYATLEHINSMPVDSREAYVPLAVECLLEGGDGTGMKAGYLIMRYKVRLHSPIPPESNV